MKLEGQEYIQIQKGIFTIKINSAGNFSIASNNAFTASSKTKLISDLTEALEYLTMHNTSEKAVSKKEIDLLVEV